MAQFTSFIDPFIILMAIPPGLAGVALILLLTGSTLNIMSLMGVIMMTGIVVSNSILIVEFAGHSSQAGHAAARGHGAGLQGPPAAHSHDFAGHAAGHDSHGAGTGSGQRAVCAAGARHHRRARVSVVVTVFLVPAVYLVIHGRRRATLPPWRGIEAKNEH